MKIPEKIIRDFPLFESPYFERLFLSLRVFPVFNSSSECVCRVLARRNAKSNVDCQIEFPYYIKLGFFSFGKNPHQSSDIATISAAKHQHSDKSLKIKFKALKERENDTLRKDVASLFGVLKSTFSNLKKKTKKKSCNQMKMALGLKQ